MWGKGSKVFSLHCLLQLFHYTERLRYSQVTINLYCTNYNLELKVSVYLLCEVILSSKGIHNSYMVECTAICDRERRVAILPHEGKCTATRGSLCLFIRWTSLYSSEKEQIWSWNKALYNMVLVGKFSQLWRCVYVWQLVVSVLAGKELTHMGKLPHLL